MLISGAQNFADAILMRALKHVRQGAYIEVGAHDPLRDSVSLAFDERGWRGLHAAATPASAQRLRAARPDEEAVEAAVSAGDGPLTFYEVGGAGKGTGDPAAAEDHRAAGHAVGIITAPRVRLSDLLGRFGDRPIHWLKIDVEGMETDVLDSWAPSPARPWIVVVKSARPNPPEPTDHEWEPMLLALGYAFVYDDGLNRFYVSDAHPELKDAFGPGPNGFDDPSLTAASPSARLPAGELQAHDEETARLAQELADKLDVARALDDMRKSLAEAAAQRDAAARHLASVAAELDNTRDALARAERDVAAKQAETDHLKSELAAVTAELDDAQDALARAERKAAAKLAELANLRSALTRSEREAAAMQAHMNGLQARIAALHSSTSWRITGPLRAAIHAMRFVARGARAWGTLAPGSRPHRLLKGMAELGMRDQRLGGAARLLLPPFPRLKGRLFAATHDERGAAQGPVARVAPPADHWAEKTSSPGLAQLPVAPAVGPTFYLFVDHTVACPVNTGVQRTARGLASGLVRLGQRVRYVKWDARAGRCALLDANERAALARWNGPEITREDRAIYPPTGAEPLGVEPQDGDWLIVPEVTHLTFQSAPVTLDLILWARRHTARVGFVFYDAIPLRRDEFAAAAPAHAAYMRALLLADVVWPISQWSADDLVAFWTVSEKATAATMPRVMPLHLPGAFDRPRTTQASSAEKLILSFGTLEQRKNQVALIRAFQAYRKAHPDSGWRLTLVGNLHPLVARDVQEATAADPAIRHLGHVSDEELSSLLDACAFTVFPSVEEGFGLPILESLWHGKPCLCADFGAMGEVAAGGGCLTVNVRDETELTRALQTLIDDGGLRARLTQEAIARPMAGWEDYARSVRDSARAMTPPVIYYWVNATVSFPKNTGIQRVARQLARAWINSGARLVPVKFDPVTTGFAPVTSKEERAHLARWNGPAPDQWGDWIEPQAAGPGSWFVMPELPLDLAPAQQEGLRAFVMAQGLRMAAIFYDAIPWKMRAIYPEAFAQAHKNYMAELGNYDRVLCISRYSAEDLRAFLRKEATQCDDLEARVIPVPLAGEFAQARRITTYSPREDGEAVSILCVGTVEPRKNHETLLRAFVLASQRASRPLRLTIAGGSHSIEPALADRVRAFIADHPSITWEEHADDARLHDLHRSCDFTVYPSVEEGFGLPILESLWYAKPAICAGFGSMAEVAEGGGCVMVDVRDAKALADAICTLADNPRRLRELAREAARRPFKSWRDYAHDVADRLAELDPPQPAVMSAPADDVARRAQAMGLTSRPKLSVCISTYNRAEWLAKSLQNWARLYPRPLADVELLVCDNASADHTPKVVKPYLDRPDFSYRRNPVNVGMLGNLRETTHAAQGDYVWILGDDDLLMPGAIERVLKAIDDRPGVALVYLNYVYTRVEDARKVTDFDAFFAEATPIVPPEPDRAGPIRTICARNENFFTAIYTLVFRRDHAIRAYSQDTSGRPFSTMLTCIPTTYYVLNHMMEEDGVWIGAPQVVVNLNVSWTKYAPLWILERIPEVYDVAESKGVPSEDIDRWRAHTFPGVVHFFKDILTNDPLNNAAYVSPARVVRRFARLPEFVIGEEEMRKAYVNAHRQGHPAAREAVTDVFPERSSA